MQTRKAFTLLLLALLVCSGFAFFAPRASAYIGTITYSAASNTITCVGGASGAPITFNDVYLADVSNGWGVVEKQGLSQFLFSCKVQIGDGSTQTYFADVNKHVAFVDGLMTTWEQWIISVRSSAVANFGVLVDSVMKITNDGCVFQNLESVYLSRLGMQWGEGQANFYGCVFFGRIEIDSYDMVNVVFQSGALPEAIYHDVYNLNSFGGSVGLQFVGGSINRINVFGDSRALYSYGVLDLTYKGVYARGCGYLMYVESATDPCEYKIVDADVDNWNFHWINSGGATIYRQYTFDLTVLNGEISDFVEDANVTLAKNGVEIGSWVTNSSGQISSQVLTYGYYQESTGDALQDGSYPFVLTVTHPDWANYTSSFYVTEKTKLTVSMQEPDTPPSYNSAVFIFTPSNPTTNQTVSFNASGSNSTGVISSYAWEFGDGDVASGVSVSHAYNSTGNYTVTLMISGSNGTATYSQVVDVVDWVASDESTALVIVGVVIMAVAVSAIVLLLFFRRQDDG